MTKKDFIKKVAQEVQSTQKDAEVFIDAVFNSVVNLLLEGDNLRIYGLGEFSTKLQKARSCTDFKTGEKINVPARMKVKFTPSPTLKQQVSEMPIKE